MVTIVEEDAVVEFRGFVSTLLAGFIDIDKPKRFAFEMDVSPTIICNKTVYPTKIQNVYVILENWDLEIHEVNSVDASMFFRSPMQSVFVRVQEAEYMWVEIDVQK